MWGEPINLSRSGAAAAPTLLATTEGWRVYWQDAIDGLTASAEAEGDWGPPQSVSLQVAASDDTQQERRPPRRHACSYHVSG